MERLRLTKSEEELMNLFWKEDKPLTSTDIGNLIEDNSTSGKYIHKLLKSLEKQNLIGVCGVVQSGSRYVRQFKPLLTAEEVAARSIITQGFDKSNVAEIAVALVKETRGPEENVNNDDLIKELEEMLDNFKNKGKE